MATISEDFVSFETAKLLKEKGFNERLHTFYTTVEDKKEGYFQIMAFTDDKIDNNHSVYCYLAPTLQMAMKWLREEKNIFIDICTLSPLVYIYRVCLISDTTGYFYEDYACEEGERFMSYKEAVEFALDYCLNNILEV